MVRMPKVADDVIESYIFDALSKQEIVVEADTEVRSRLSMVGVSNNRMMTRLGSMVRRGIVLRCRRQMEAREDSDRPITYKIRPRYLPM